MELHAILAQGSGGACVIIGLVVIFWILSALSDAKKTRARREAAEAEIARIPRRPLPAARPPAPARPPRPGVPPAFLSSNLRPADLAAARSAAAMKARSQQKRAAPPARLPTTAAPPPPAKPVQAGRGTIGVVPPTVATSKAWLTPRSIRRQIIAAELLAPPLTLR